MKKLLSLVLATVMVLSMTTIALAKTAYVETDGYFSIDTDVLDGGSYFMPGVTYYLPIEDGDELVDSEILRDFSVRMSLKVVEGKEFVDTCKIVERNGGSYVEFKPKRLTSRYEGEMKDVKIELTCTEYGNNKDHKVTSEKEAERYNKEITANGGSSKDLVSINDYVYYKGITTETLTITYPDAVYLDEGDYDVDNDNPIVIASSGTSQTTLHFGDTAEFDAKFGYSEKKLNLGYSVMPISSVEKNNPNAELVFFVLNGAPTFAANGDLRIYGDNLKYLYQITGDTLTQLSATVKSDYIQYRTQNLTGYVASDRPLTGKVTQNPLPETPPTSGDTGTTLPADGNKTSYSTTDIANLVTAAVQAKTTSGSATAILNNPRSLTPDMINTAKNTAKTVSAQKGLSITPLLACDTTAGGSVVSRLYITPSAWTSKTEISMGFQREDAGVQNLFTTWYRNPLRVVKFEHAGSFGMPVTVAVKLDLTGMNTQNLKFYNYSTTTNRYTLITKPNYSVDNSGYLYFTTNQGGNVLITDGLLAAR